MVEEALILRPCLLSCIGGSCKQVGKEVNDGGISCGLDGDLNECGRRLMLEGCETPLHAWLDESPGQLL